MVRNNTLNPDFKSDISGLTTKYFNYILQLNALLAFLQKIVQKPQKQSKTDQ